MFALLPIVGGLILGLLAPRRLAIAIQVVFLAIAAVAMTISAPDHGGSYTDAFWLVPILALASAATLAAGFWIARRRAARQQTQP
jgi:Sec-independent protein secretion pathway component TatC